MWMSSYIAESSRDVAKDMAKDSLRASAAAILTPDTVFQGKIRNLVKSDRSKYSKIRRSSRSFLHRILYCQSGISNEIASSSSSSSSSSGSGGRGINPKSIINHEFLVIVMKIRGKRHIFLAEKCGSGANCGINIRAVKDEPEEMGALEEAQVSAFDCEDTPMNLEEVLAILEDHDPNYAAQENNCWKYAVQTTQGLLMACQAKTGKAHFGEQAKLVGAKVTVSHVREMTARGLQILLNVLTR